MKNLTFKAAMLNDSRTTVNRQSTDGQSQRHYKKTPLSKRWKVLMTLIFLFTMGIGQMWGAYYTPTADEVIILNEVYSSTATDAGYSTHSAIAWAGTGSTKNDRKCGDPNNGGAATSANVVSYSAKGNGRGKNITVSITGCSKIILYHESNKSRYVELKSGNNSGDLIGKGLVSTYYTEVALTGSTSYDIFLHGTDGSKDQDFYIYAIKLIKDNSGSTPAADSYTVKYMYGTTELGTESVEVGSKPTASSINKNKDFYTFEAWQLSGVDKSLTDDSWKSVVKDAIVTLTARYSGPTYSSSATLISADVVSSTPNVNTVLAASNIVSSITFKTSQYEFTSNTTKPGYYGYKVNTENDKITLLVKQGKRVKVLFGSLKKVPTIKVNNVSKSLDADRAEGNTAENTFTYTATGEDALVSITFGSGTSTLKKVDIFDLYTATRVDEMNLVDGEDNNVTEVTLPTPSETTVTVAEKEYTFTGWTPSTDVKVGEENKGTSDVLTAGTVVTLLANTTFTAQWQEVSDFDVKFFQGYGEPDVQIGTTQRISTGNYATAPDDPTRTGFAFLGWSTDGTEANIVDVATYSITAATNFTAMWKAVWTVTFDGAGSVEVQDGETVASPDSPTQAGKVFQGWYNGESKYNFSAAVTGNLALESKWAAADPNHFYYTYNDDFHFDGVVYKTPQGKTTDPEASEATKNLSNPYTLFSGAEGIEEIKVTNGIYDYKKAADNKHVTAYLKLKKDDATSNLAFTIKSGYTAVLKIKMGGYSKKPVVTLKKGDDAVPATSGTIKGTAPGKSYEEITYNLTAGTYVMTSANQTLYISHIDLEATALPTYTVTYKAGEGTGDDVVDANTYYAGDEVTLMANPFTPASGFMFSGWVVSKATSGDPVSVSEGKFSMPNENVTVTAQWEDVSKVARIIETDAKYESLAAAITAAEAGQTIQLLQNIEQANGVEIAKDLILDLNNFTYTCTSGSNVNSRAIKITDSDVTVKNGTIAAVTTANFESGCYGAFRIEGATANVTLRDLTMTNGRHYGLGIKLVNGRLDMEDCTVTSINGAGGLEVGTGTALVTNCTFTQSGFESAHAWIATCLATCYMGNLEVQGGTYTSEHYVLYVYSSGGAMDVKSGTFEGDICTAMDLNSYPTAEGSIEIEGGSFRGVGGAEINFAATTDKDEIAISAGTFNTPIENQYCAEGYVPQDNGDGSYGVKPKDGVCLIWGDVAKNSLTRNAAKSQYNGTLANTDVRDNTTTLDELVGHKFQAGGYLSLALEGQDFKAGDQVAIFVTSLNGLADKLRVYNKNEAKDANVVAISDENMTTGVNKATLAADASTIYLRRGDDYNSWNPCVAYVAVYRPMMPKLTAITINGRDGVIDPLDDKHFTVTIPNDANLASLTIVPTIVRNAPHATTPEQVMTNSGAWVLTADGDNTYRIMDKDGDYTDYTITLIRDVLKHTVSFNTHGGSAIADVEVVHGQYLAAAPADPTKDENTFKFWSEDEDGAEVDVTTVQINTDKEFHAVWEAEPAGIKLFDGEGNLNTTNFISPAKTTIEINEVEHVCLEQFSSNRTSLGGATPADMVKYDVTTDEAKIKMTFYNNNSSIKKAILYKYEEGGTPEKIEIEVPGQEIFTTEYYTFNSSKNRSFYVCMNDRSNIRVLQVKVIDNGANPVKQFGQVGYSLNLNKGRFYAKAAVEKNFEGFTFTPSSEYKVYNNSNLATTSANSFTIASPAVMSVTRSGGKYYVYQDPADKGTLYSGNAEIELNTTGTWYISSETSGSAASFSTIEFLAPKCEKPTIETQPATKQTFDPGNLTATVVATVADGGTLKYQWYDAATDEEVENATEATLTTTTEGTYYVIVTNTLADHRDNFIKSAEATLGYRVTNDATLSALSASAGTLDPTFDKDVEEYRVDLPEGTVDVPTLSATATMDGYANVDINNATAFVNYEATSTVVVTSEDGTANKTYTVKFYVDHVYTALVDVTESTTWNWRGSEDVTINDVANKGLILANYIDGANFEMIEGKAGEYARRAQNDGVYQGTYLHFNTTVAGKVKFYFRAPSNGENCTIYVNNNGKKMTAGVRTNSFGWSNEIVVKGDVVIEMENDKEGGGTTRVQQIVFTELTPDYTRNVSNNIGTLCVDHNVLVGGAMGATFYQIASRNELYDYKIDFEEVLPNEELKAGEPYIFKSNTGKIELFYGTTVADAPVAVRGMHGWFSNTEEFTMLEITEENKSDILYIAQNKLWNCEDLVDGDLKVVNNRAYIVMSEVPTYADYVASQNSNNAPRRRVTLSKDEAQVATGMGEIEASEAPMKVLINGQIFIIRGEKMFDATGRLVK